MKKQILKSIVASIAGMGLTAGIASATFLSNSETNFTNDFVNNGYDFEVSLASTVGFFDFGNDGVIDGGITSATWYNATEDLYAYFYQIENYDQDVHAVSAFTVMFGDYETVDLVTASDVSSFWLNDSHLIEDTIPYATDAKTDGSIQWSFLGNNIEVGETSYWFGAISSLEPGQVSFNVTNSGSGEIAGVVLAPVPEPTTMLLFGTGLAGLAGVARRRRK